MSKKKSVEKEMRLTSAILFLFQFYSPIFSQTAEEYYYLALSAYENKRTEDQIKYAEKALEMFELENLITDAYFYSLFIASRGYEKKHEYDRAIKFYTRAIQKCDPISQKFATFSAYLGNLYFIAGDYKNAVLWNEKVVEISKKILEPYDRNYLISLNNLAKAYVELGEYSKAEQLYLEGLEVNTQVFGKEHPAYAVSLGNLGDLYRQMDNYSKAEKLLIEACKILEKVFGQDSPEYSKYLFILGALYMEVGDYDKSERLFITELQLFNKLDSNYQHSFAVSLINLGELYMTSGNYLKAKQIYIDALQIMERSIGVTHPDYAKNLINLGKLYRTLGNYTKAEPLFYQASEILKKAFGSDNTSYLSSLNLLGLLYHTMGNYLRAEQLFLEALGIVKKGGGNHPYYATFLFSLGVVYYAMHEYSKAEPIFIEILEIFNGDHAGANCMLGTVYSTTGNYNKAKLFLTESLNIHKKATSSDYTDQIVTLSNLGFLFLAEGDFVRASEAFDSALTIEQKNIRVAFSSLSESEKKSFVAKGYYIYEVMLSALSMTDSQSYTSMAAHLLFRKGLVIKSSVNTRYFVFNSSDEMLKQKYSDWLSIQKEKNYLYSKTTEQRNNAGLDLDSLEEVAVFLEKELSRMSATFEDFVMIPDFKWEDVRKNLKPGEAVVDLVKYQLYDKKWTDATRYGVFITKNDSQEPVYFEFKDGNRIDALIIPKLNELNRNRFADASNDEEDDANVVMLGDKDELDFYSELFAPIAEYLNGVKKIYFSLDGEFYKVNFNTLRNPATGKFL